MTTVDYQLYPAQELGLDETRLQDLIGRLQYAVDSGPLPSLQVAVARHGRLALFRAFGAADTGARYNTYSCIKPLVASAIWKLMGEGRIDITLPVCHYVPAFADNGKQEVTVEQVLCHTSGFPSAPMGPPDWWTRESRLQRMRGWYLNWEPGTRMVYHATSAHWVLVELVACVTGADYRDYIRTEIIEHLGLTGLRLGVPLAEQGDIMDVAHVGEPPSADELQALFGRAVDWPSTVDETLLVFNQPEVRELGVPGGGGISSAADMALFYQALLQNPGGLWDAAVLADALSRVRVDFPDPITGVPANRGLGVVIAGADAGAPYRGMGANVSAGAFGHQGVGGQVAWADPASGLSFCLFTNGLDANSLRSARLCSAASNRAAALVA